MQTSDQLRRAFRRVCQALEVERPFRVSPQHDGSAHIEIAEDRYHYVVTERGTELERRTTSDADELLYWLACNIVGKLASTYESQHRVEGQSYRRLLFERELELLGRIKPEWVVKRRAEIARILRNHPFDDKAEGQT